MRSAKVLQSFSLVALVAICSAQSSNDSCEVDIFKYPCANRYYPYKLDNEPADYGIVAGQYQAGKEHLIGLTTWLDASYVIAPLQLDPPGIATYDNGKPIVFNDTERIWYLYNDKSHKYTWVNSQNGEIPPFAIKVGEDRTGFPLMPGRISRDNGLVYVGTVAPTSGTMIYENADGDRDQVTSGYQVLTCKSSVANETQMMTPKLPSSGPNVDTGCINNWVPYLGDDAPLRNGLSAGNHTCNDTAFVGKGKPSFIVYPGRIQITDKAGFYTTDKNKGVFMANNSYYLADNPHYTYSWVEFDGSTPENAVKARNDIGGLALPVARVRINKQVEIGRFAASSGIFLSAHGTEDYLDSFEVLVCDPWPRYQCAQQWKTFNVSNATMSPSADGFEVGTLNGSITVYVGRSCDVNVGRAQAAPAADAGVYYLDDYTAAEEFDNATATAEYLMTNSRYTYKWVASRFGEQVPNALEQHKEGHRPFYIGMTRINENVFVGKVRPGEGLFYLDQFGRQRSTSAYNVLTCTSPDADNGLYEEESELVWLSDHWCPARKTWNVDEMACVCRNEFRNIDGDNHGVWDEASCSYK